MTLNNTNRGDKTMKKISTLLVMVLVTALIFQAGFVVYANVVVENTASEPNQEVSTETNTEISEEILDQIQESDPANFDKNVTNYKQLLVSLNVHPLIKEEIERLIMEGHAISQLLIGYEFLYQQYGTMLDLEGFIAQKSSGETWKSIFSAYNSVRKEFIPRAFDPMVLEDLMNRPSLTSDDIMIADLVAFYTDRTFEDLIEIKQFPSNWNGSLAAAGFIYNAETLPRVQITTEQLAKYSGQGGLSEDKVAEAFVLAHKLGIEAEVVIEKFKNGYTEEAIFAESYLEQYN
jgi:hypothetical protein